MGRGMGTGGWTSVSGLNVCNCYPSDPHMRGVIYSSKPDGA